MWESLAGVAIGGLLAHFTSVYNNMREDKRIEQKLEQEELQQQREEKKFELQLKQEKKNQLREDKLNRLYKVLIPVIEIYEKDNRLYDTLDRNGVNLIGLGIQPTRREELNKIIAEDKRYMSIELIKLFSQVEADYEYISEHGYISSMIWNLEQNNEAVADFTFDEHGIFIKKVEEEAKEIEEEYN